MEPHRQTTTLHDASISHRTPSNFDHLAALQRLESKRDMRPYKQQSNGLGHVEVRLPTVMKYPSNGYEI